MFESSEAILKYTPLQNRVLIVAILPTGVGCAFTPLFTRVGFTENIIWPGQSSRTPARRELALRTCKRLGIQECEERNNDAYHLRPLRKCPTTEINTTLLLKLCCMSSMIPNKVIITP